MGRVHDDGGGDDPLDPGNDAQQENVFSRWKWNGPFKFVHQSSRLFSTVAIPATAVRICCSLIGPSRSTLMVPGSTERTVDSFVPGNRPASGRDNQAS
jgi:hypothetical protein